MRFLPLFFLSLCTLVFALKPHTASYTLLISDFEIGKEMRSLRQNKNVYHYTAHAKTTGLSSLFKDYEIRSKSTFVIDKFGLNSKHYQSFERDGDTIKKDFNVYPATGQVDSLNRVLVISHNLEKNPKKLEFNLLVHDGIAVEKQYYRQVPSGHDNLIKVISKERNLSAYFAKDKYYLPVLLHRDNFTYKLNTIKFN